MIGLIFHGIGTPARPLDSGEAPYWISASFFEEVLDLVLSQPDPTRIRLSFDDGNLSDHDIALPRLRARGLRADFFVLTGRIGTPGSLDVTHIHALQAAGMGIGSHGVDHVSWAGLPPDALRHELEHSCAVLEDICGAPVRTAAIPFGAYNAKTLRALAAAGYETAYSSDGGQMRPGAFLQPRTSVRGDATLSGISDILADRISVGRRMRRTVKRYTKRIF